MDCGDPSFNISSAKQWFKTGQLPEKWTFNESMTVECVIGHIWKDGDSFKKITCEERGAWTVIPICERIDFVYICFGNSHLSEN